VVEPSQSMGNECSKGNTSKHPLSSYDCFHWDSTIIRAIPKVYKCYTEESAHYLLSGMHSTNQL